MSVVVDSSVLVAALVDSGPQGSWAEDIVASGSLHAPELVRAEATNVLRRLERAKHITTAEANAAHDEFMQLELELFPFDPFADRVWELRHTITSYDAWYVAVAEALRLPLATLDGKLAKASRASCDVMTPRL
ncbi:MAG: type II toxin-antitoxin system VapC family toxin [Gammaproteobacteria bacterium]|nr:MAG: type II toxin-antitoxin system VapC family toxin [Gammaproteobacteria bacterium]TLZ59426.1 MAG: type II toxin-antitoxin system VapC family toxin [Gammaproteobacteria bacterium]